MSALVRAAEHAEWAWGRVVCRFRGHDWRVWTVVGTEVTSAPICERCGLMQDTKEADH